MKGMGVRATREKAVEIMDQCPVAKQFMGPLALIHKEGDDKKRFVDPNRKWWKFW